MGLILKGFDSNNNLLKLPCVLWYEHFIGRFGFEETFTIGFAEKVPISLTKVIITKENKKEIECFVDSIVLQTNRYNFYCVVKFKNNICRLFENQVLPKIHHTLTLKKMLKLYADEFKLSCVQEDAYEIEIKNFYVDMGMTALDVINFFFQAVYKEEIFLNENNQLTLPYSNAVTVFFGDYNKNQSGQQIKGLNYNKLKLVDDRSRLISDAFIKIVYEDNDSDYLHLTPENEFATNCNIKRVKYKNVPICWQVLPKSGCEYLIQKENKNRITYELSTFENIDIFPGTIAKIKEIDEDVNLLVLEVLTTFNNQGKKTKILFRKTKIK